MKKILFTLIALVAANVAQADLRIFATVPEWGALAKEIGGDKVKVYSATSAFQDPHRIEAKPSLLAQARQAGLVVAVGADLEIGWLPLVLRDSGNAAIQPGAAGVFRGGGAGQSPRHSALLSIAPTVTCMPPAIPISISIRAMCSRLPRNSPPAWPNSMRPMRPPIRPAMPPLPASGRRQWLRWEKEAAPLKGLPVLVHHQSFAYLSHWLGLKELGSLEPKPGIEPSSGQLSALLAQQQRQPARLVLRTAYQQEGPSQWIAGKTGMPAVLLPYTVGGTPEAKDLFGLFDDTIQRLLKGAR